MSELLQAEGQDLQLFRGETLGSGAYGVVCKAKLNELPCAAKLLHRVLFHPTIQRRFDQEHELLRSMRHPNVVQYLGIAHDPLSGLPILLMELLDGNLTDFLEHSQEPLPYHVQVNLWHDIALALTYLHSKHIIHRDLSGNNVLLIAGSRAKVTDFGMSMFTYVDATKSRLTNCPGNANYMSPEALIERPTYSETLDVFSSGVVALQILTRNFPNPSQSMTCHDDPKSPTGFSVVFVPEVERRKDDINLVNPKHPMLPVILGCLSDKKQNRPSARQLCCQLVTLKGAAEYTESLQQKSPQERVREQEQQIQEQEQQIQEQEQQIKEQKQQIQELEKQIDNERQQNQKQHHVVLQLQNDITVKGRELQKLEQKIQEQKQENREQEQVVQQLVHEQQQAIHEQQQQLLEQQSSIQWMQTQITKSEKGVQVLNTRLDENSQELQSKKQELWKARYNLQQKTEEFQHKREKFQGQLQQTLQDQDLQEFQVRIMELEMKLKENQDQRRLMEQLPPVFVERFTAEELPQHLKKLIEEGFQEWKENLCKLCLFCEHPSSGDLMETKLEVHKNMTLGEVTERAYQVLELGQCGVQLEQCQLVRYNGKSGTFGKPFDEPKETPFGEVMSGPQSSSFHLFMEIQTDPAALPRHEQIMRARRVIRTNYSLLWQHLDASKVLPKLVDKSVISEAMKKDVESYQQSCAQNAVIIDALFTVECTPEGLLTVCDTLLTTPGREHIAQHILRDYRRQPLAVRVLHSLASGNDPLFSEVSLQFQNLERAVVDLLVQCPDALTQLKQSLASLVLPVGDGKVASLVDPSSYETANTIPKFFRLMAPHWNCLSTNLLSLLLEASGCKPAAAKLAEFEEARASRGPLVLCTQTASTSELRSVHSSPLEQLQSLHPAVFTESRAAVHAERNTARITAEVDKPMLHVSCLEEVTTAICGFFRLPKAALVYAGCSENPLALCWLVSRNLLPYMRSYMGGTSGELLLAEQQITQIAFGDTDSYRCLNLKEVELHEASTYGLLERIPVLLTSVSVDAADADGVTALHVACLGGHDQVVELLLQAGASVDQKAKDGATALHLACLGGHDQVIELLLQAGASVDQKAKDGEAALFIASSEGHDQIVELLLRREANVNHQTKDGSTPLWTASLNDHQRVVELLLAAGANPDIQKEDGATALHVACLGGHDWVVELLLQAGASVDQKTEAGATALHLACLGYHDQVVELLLQAGASVDQKAKDGEAALFIASSEGHDQIVELLLRREANVNHQTKDGRTPLWTASLNDHPRVVELLLAAGANPDIQKEDGVTALHVACLGGHDQVVELLLQAGASVDQKAKDGATALHLACLRGHDWVVELLLQAGASVDQKAKDGATALHLACLGGHDQVVELLLQAGVCVDQETEDGVTALHLACLGGHNQVAELLLQAGASVDQKVKDGETALYIASRKGHDQIVELLLRREANVNHQNKDGRTPLWTASLNGHQKVVELLLAAGANPDIHDEGHDQVVDLLLQAGASVEQETKDGQTALFIASSEGHDQIVELLLRREADVNHQTKDGETPLWSASFDGHQRVVELLLAAGAKPDITEEDGWTPFHAASQEGHDQVAELLLQAGASVEQETEDGKTALFIASSEGHDQIVELLLRREANVNHQTKHGQTPLSIARSEGHNHIVQLLREADRQRTATKSPVTPAPKTPTAQSHSGPLSRFFKFWYS